MGQFRRFLWYVGCIILLPLAIYGITEKEFLLAMPALLLFGACIVLSFKKITCPNCGKTIRTINTKINHCLSCGAKLPE